MVWFVLDEQRFLFCATWCEFSHLATSNKSFLAKELKKWFFLSLRIKITSFSGNKRLVKNIISIIVSVRMSNVKFNELKKVPPNRHWNYTNYFVVLEQVRSELGAIMSFISIMHWSFNGESGFWMNLYLGALNYKMPTSWKIINYLTSKIGSKLVSLGLHVVNLSKKFHFPCIEYVICCLQFNNLFVNFKIASRKKTARLIIPFFRKYRYKSRSFVN